MAQRWQYHYECQVATLVWDGGEHADEGIIGSGEGHDLLAYYKR